MLLISAGVAIGERCAHGDRDWRLRALPHGPHSGDRGLALSRAGSVGDAVYFTFVTGLTIGYGDIVPRQALARVLVVRW